MNLLDQLHQLAPLAAAATGGPWHIVEDHDGMVAAYLLTLQAGSCTDSDGQYNDLGNLIIYDDAAFIAAARNLLTPENLALLVKAVVVPEAVSRPAVTNEVYSTILLSQSLGMMAGLLATIELLQGRVAKRRLDNDDLNEIERIVRTVKELQAELREQIAQNTAVLLANATALIKCTA